MVKKDFFQVPSVGDILGRDCVREISGNLIDEIIETGEDEACVITRGFIPDRFRGAKEFLKYGPKVGFSDFVSSDSSGWGKPKSGYDNWVRERGVDFLRTFSLYQNLEGSGIVRYCYDEFGIDNVNELIYSTNRDGVDFFEC